jgi:hypothetical protein
MSPRLVPAARGGATGKALAVGAAHHSGGAEGARISAASITSLVQHEVPARRACVKRRLLSAISMLLFTGVLGVALFLKLKENRSHE